MIDDKDKNNRDDGFPDDDTFGDENFDIDSDDFSDNASTFESSFDLDSDNESSSGSPADDSENQDRYSDFVPSPLSELSSETMEGESEENASFEDHSNDDEKDSQEETEDVFETFDEEDDPFELQDDDDSFGSETDTDNNSFAGEGLVQGAPVKLIGGFAAAVALGFVAWQMFSGGSQEIEGITTAQRPAEISPMAGDDDSELAALFTKGEEEVAELANELDPRQAPNDMSSEKETLTTADTNATPSLPMNTESPAEDTPSTPERMAETPQMKGPDKTLAPSEPTIVKAEIDLSEIESMLQDYNEVMTARMRRVESNLRGVTDDLDDINRNLGNMGDQVAGMGHLVSNMSEQFKMLGSSQETDRREMAKQEMFANPTLHVHAIIPGRAWLKKHDGGILTVSEGDLLGEYGKVLAIDASSGAIITSSGVTLR